MILVRDAFTFLPSHIFYRLSFSVLLILVDDDNRQGREGIAWDRDEISERAMYTNLDDVRCRVPVHKKHRGAVAYSGKSHDFSSASDETTRTTRFRPLALSFARTPLTPISVWRAKRVDKQRVSARADGRKINSGGDARCLVAHSRYCSYLFIHCYI